MNFISSISYGFKNYANTKTSATRAQLYYWFFFALTSLLVCTVIDMIFFDTNTYTQLLEINNPVGWFSRIWFWSIITPSITIIIRRIKNISKPIRNKNEVIDIPLMIVILFVMLFILAY